MKNVCKFYKLQFLNFEFQEESLKDRPWNTLKELNIKWRGCKYICVVKWSNFSTLQNNEWSCNMICTQKATIFDRSSPLSHSFPRPRPSFSPMSNVALNPLLGPIVTFTCTLMDRLMMKIEILMSQSKSLVIIANKLKANVTI